MNYRNKTCFDWNDYKRNNISSIQSLDFMDSLKSKLQLDEIKNVIVRNINDQIGVIIQHVSDIDYNHIFKIVEHIIDELNLNLRYFSFQKDYNGTYVKTANIINLKKSFIEFKYNNKTIMLLPDSFFQPNINVLDSYYDFFKECINITKCKNMVNIGDDGGNIGTILSDEFNIINCYLHCHSTIECLKNMILKNRLSNISYFSKMDDLIDNTTFMPTSSTLVFINPGRNGIKDKEHIFLGIKRYKYIIYMACEKKAFKKDYERMDYEIVKSQELITMPNTKKTQINYLLQIKSQKRCSR